MDKCNKCPSCGCKDFEFENEFGKGFRVCFECKQEWWTDINYEKYISPSYYYEIYTNLGKHLPPKDRRGDVKSFDKRSAKRMVRKLVKSGFTVTAFLTKPGKKRELIYCNWEPTGFVNSIGI